jgi:hypothetical protein
MKYLKIVIEPFKIKGDTEDPDTLQQDVYERISAMVESESLAFSVDEDYEDEDSDY